MAPASPTPATAPEAASAPDTAAATGTLVICGGRPLRGEIAPAGAKNAVLPLLVAASLGERPTTLRNVPTALNDVRVLLRCLTSVGAHVRVVDDTTVELAAGDAPRGPVEPDASRIRYSLLLLGRAAALGHTVTLPLSGGCAIGDRGHDLHVLALRALGAAVDETETGLTVRPERLRGATVEFRLPTTGGTENALLAATRAEGETVLRNANTRPEIRQMAELLNRMGADVSLGSRVARVRGRGRLPGGAEITVMPGWDEAVTYLAAGALTGGEVCVRGVPAAYVHWDLVYLREAGAEVFEWNGDLYLKRTGPLRPFDAITGPPPHLNSDMQPIFTALALFCPGDSTLTDTRFQDRFQYAAELRRFGADVEILGNTALVAGGRPLSGARVRATDLRGGAAAVLVALGIDAESRVGNAYQIGRGYPHLEAKLRSLGADVTFVAE